MDMNSNREQGFILITVLVLLAVLTIAAIASNFKTNVASKIARSSSHLDQAFIAANAGLTQIYWYWSSEGNSTTGGIKEFKDLSDFLNNGTTAPSIYKPALAVSKTSDAPTDAQIQADSGFKVYTLTSLGISSDVYTWAAAEARFLPQVAVWMTTFDDVETDGYPYKTSVDKTTSTCPHGCRVVTYALGRYDQSRVLLRESQSFLDQKLGGVSAMTNAPAGDTFSTICSGGASDGTFSNGQLWPISPAETTPTGPVLIEATQAMFQKDSVPSGTAMASNTEFRKHGSFLFREGNSSKTGAVFEHTPLIMYSGHGRDTTAKDEAVKVDFASHQRKTTAENLPSDYLPLKLVDAPLMVGTKKIQYFAEKNSNLFNIDSYRWAAEQLTCQNPAALDGIGGNGNYCSRGELLRQSLVAMGYPAYAPVTGRLTAAQFEYNVANAIPMFGFVRLMMPAIVATNSNKGLVRGGGNPVYSETCDGKTYKGHILGGEYQLKLGTPAHNFGINNPGSPATGAYNKGTIFPNNGKLGNKARMIVYGTVVIDYFHDAGNSGNGNGFFDADATGANAEWILTPLESPDVFFQPDFPILINPVMPRFTGVSDPYAVPTAARNPRPLSATNDLTTSGRVNMAIASGSSPASVNLASPYDGHFPWAEGMMFAPNTVDLAGTMRLMSRKATSTNLNGDFISTPIIDGVGLIEMAQGFGRNTKVNTVTTSMKNLLALDNPERTGSGTEEDILHYYYDLMKPTVDPYNAMDYPVAPWPGHELGSNFCMGTYDCGTSDPAAAPVYNHMGDKMHLMFPTGYMHGWKVALAALNLNADEFNHILSGAGTQLGIVAGLYPQITACTALTCPAGRPFSIKDAGFKNLAAVQAVEDSESKFFYVTPDATTGYGRLDYEWKDIPSTIYSGGLIDIHGSTNMNGIMYTPGPLEWGTTGGLSYINGSIITGYGMSVGYRNGSQNSNYLVVYDMQSVDNATTSLLAIKLRRYDWQRLY